MLTRTKIILLVLFFVSLLGMWLAEYRKIPTAEQRRRMAGRVLPALIDTHVDEVRAVEITGGSAGPIVFERRDEGGWRMTAPVDAVADPSMVDSLVTSLKTLRPITGAESLHGDPKTFGLDPPARVVRLLGADSAEPLAALEVGTTVDTRRYVRDLGQTAIEVVDARWLASVEKPAIDWRNRAIFSLSTFEVGTLAVKGPDRELEAKRSAGRWNLLRPFAALADSRKMESVIADLTSLRVVDGAKGYVADNVRDFAPYGLDKPSMTISLTSSTENRKAQVLEVGAFVPDVADRAYARLADQDDVILIQTKTIHDLGLHPKDLRSRRIADLDPARVDIIQIDVSGQEHIFVKGEEGWEIASPTAGRADSQSIQTLITRLNEAETSEFLTPASAPRADLDKPWAVVKVWQRGLSSLPAPSADGSVAKPSEAPALDLRLGRHMVVAKVVYAQTAGDPTVLTLPDYLVPLIPKNPLSYRDRNLMVQDPNRIERLTIARDGITYVVEQSPSPGSSTKWRLLKPIQAPADTEAATRLAVMLAHLRADTLVTETPDDLETFGLHQPSLSVTWTVREGPQSSRLLNAGKEPTEWTLQLGKAVPGRSDYRFAHLSGSPIVFTLSPAAVELLSSELHDRRVLNFPLDQVVRVVLRWPALALAFNRRHVPLGAPEWLPEPGQAPPGGIDGTRINVLLAMLSNTQAMRFTQYQGSIAATTGLNPPLLTIEVQVSGERSPHLLRVGNVTPEGSRFATTATGSDGPVFLLANAELNEWLRAPGQAELPEPVFAPDAPP
jgi:Domain of unknown function (DUF4340)